MGMGGTGEPTSTAGPHGMHDKDASIGFQGPQLARVADGGYRLSMMRQTIVVVLFLGLL